MSQNSYLHELCAQISQIVFLADLTVLRLITIVWTKNLKKLISPRVLCTTNVLGLLTRLWTKMSENSYLREFCVQVSQIVLLADLTVLRLIFYSMSRNVRKLISPRVLCASVTNRVLSWFDFFSVITTVWAKMWEKSYLHEFCAKVSQNVFLADLTILRLNTIVWVKLSQSS